MRSGLSGLCGCLPRTKIEDFVWGVSRGFRRGGRDAGGKVTLRYYVGMFLEDLEREENGGL
ncbi:MAG: hypothetical protein Q8O30_11060 [Candidatus Omnitrophota bacterium]|nr:hypothetical protein [Candidatus Omnitrophota bacterium]